MSEEKEKLMGEIISQLFEEYLAFYKDKDLASVAAAATINDLLNSLEDPLMATDEVEEQVA